MDSIDLEAIISDECQPFLDEEGTLVCVKEFVKDALKEAIRRALVLASEKAQVLREDLSGEDEEDAIQFRAKKFIADYPYTYEVDKQSILEVENLIK